jgi:NAD(P)-dependent dehydrogenase (short-subunit alcohol dehydrogenase family)
MTIDLSARVAVVTGVRGRLGPIWTGALLDAGARVLGLDRRTEATAEIVQLGRKYGERLLLAAADVTDRASLGRALRLCHDRLGPPDILINNAGIDQPPGAAGDRWRFGDIPDEISAAVLDVNALGTLRACQVIGSDMAGRGTGTVVNIGSLYGGNAPDPRFYDHLPGDPPFLKPPAYGMSKAGVAALSRYLAALWGPAGVRVNTLSPGGVLGEQDQRFRAKFTARVPLGRMAQGPDLVGPLLFLASDLSRYVTGVELAVDGGYSCW